MEVLRHYIHFEDYKNVMLVSKTWRDYLIDTKGAMMFARSMSKDGYIECYKNDIEFLKDLRGRKIINMLIDTLDVTRSKKDFDLFLLKYKYPMTYILSKDIDTRPNLRAINLMGY